MSRSNDPPLSAASTSLRQSASVAEGKSPAKTGDPVGVLGFAMPEQNATRERAGQPVGGLIVRRFLRVTARTERLQLLDASDINAGKRIADPPSGDHPIGADLGERQENESALEQMGVRQG